MTAAEVGEKPRWLDKALPVETRIAALIAAMTIEEKVGQLQLSHDLDPDGDGNDVAAGRVGAGIYSEGPMARDDTHLRSLPSRIAELQDIARSRSRLGIPLMFGSDVVHGFRTTFPIPLALASSWDTDLVRTCAQQAAREGRAAGLTWTFAPMVDISSEHRWGRVGETFGDEPQLASRMGAAVVGGLEADGLAACAKHFCGYGLVHAERDHETLSVGMNALHNLHLRPFLAAIRAGCRSVMVGFNDVDGVPMHSHTHLIRDILKSQWGFRGVVVSDWSGIEQLVAQGVAADAREAARQAIVAGVDVDMVSGTYSRHLPELVAAGDVDEALVNDAVRRVLRLKFASGLFDEVAPTVSTSPVSKPGAGAVLAREAAGRSMVLLKNNGILPLHSNIGTVHLCGPFADDVDALLGAWVFPGTEPSGDTAASALADRLGAESLVVSDGRFPDLTARRADAADLTIALVGEHPSRSGEDRCLPNAELPVGQFELLRQLAMLGKPLVVVVVSGRPLELRPVMQLADAVLLAWHPGAEAGPALADVLLGDQAPSGRLPMNLPRMSRTGAIGTLERTTGRRLGRSGDIKFGRYLNALVHPELSLGFGLTYTTFAYSAVELSRDHIPVRGGVVRATVEVANTGMRPGREVVQLYLRDLVADVMRPLVELADWQAVELEPGASAKVVFKITPEMFGYWDRSLRWRVDRGDVDVIIGPNAAHGSSARLRIVD